MALKLQWNNDFPWTRRERKCKKLKMKQQNAGSNIHFIRVCITSKLERDGRRTEKKGSLLKTPQQWLSCCHRAGGTHGDITELTVWLLPSHSTPPLTFTSSSLSFPVNQNRDFSIHLLSLSAFLKPLLLTGLPQHTSHKLTMHQFPPSHHTAQVRKSSL